MKIGDEVYIHGYVDEIRKDTVIIRNEGGYFGTVPNEITQRWIPCSERLPDEDGRYLVSWSSISNKHYTITEIMFYGTIPYAGVGDKRRGWYAVDSGEYWYINIDNVIAWMPLPRSFMYEEKEDK